MQGFINVKMLYRGTDDSDDAPMRKKRILVALSAIVGVVEHKDTCTIGLSSGLYILGTIPAITVTVSKTYQQVIDMIKEAQQSKY